MNVLIRIDWKFILALGVSAAELVRTLKFDASAAERVSIRWAEACRGAVAARLGSH